MSVGSDTLERALASCPFRKNVIGFLGKLHLVSEILLPTSAMSQRALFPDVIGRSQYPSNFAK